MSGTPRCPLDATTAEVLAILERTFQRPAPDGSRPRQFHRKTHACLRGELRLDPPSDPALRHGLFAGPGRYPAVVRFSSAFFANDALPDGRGMAVKVAGVQGEVCEGAPAGQHDLVLVNQPLPPGRDAEEALSLFRLLDGRPDVSIPGLVLPRYTLPALDPRRIRWFYPAFLADTFRRSVIRRDLHRQTYYSGTAYRLGEGATRYELRPVASPGDRGRLRGRTFGARLQARLDRGPFAFELLLQPRTAEDRIDGSAWPWKGPLVRVGRLEIPPQTVADGLALGDRLAFSPWNCLRAHEPLGSLNALRRHAYAASAANRGGDPRFPGDGAAGSQSG